MPKKKKKKSKFYKSIYYNQKFNLKHKTGDGKIEYYKFKKKKTMFFYIIKKLVIFIVQIYIIKLMYVSK